ncbi:MAG: hypothetical protein O7E52_00955 [Candidatus Poribacteria bacterium]|nr:hypothetical protein [Candidatus Poribacteria bacterium]
MTSFKTLVWRPDTRPQHSPPPPQRRFSRIRNLPKRRRTYRKYSTPRRQTQRPLSPELLAQIRAEGYGRSYVQKQIRKKTPMVFELYGEHVKGVIVRRLTYSLDVRVKDRVRRIEKVDIKYMYKRERTSPFAPEIDIHPELKAKSQVSIVYRSERFQVDDSVLARSYKEKSPVALTLRGGEIIRGVIDWFSQYEIKINSIDEKGVVVFRHGLHDFEVIPGRMKRYKV